MHSSLCMGNFKTNAMILESTGGFLGSYQKINTLSVSPSSLLFCDLMALQSIFIDTVHTNKKNPPNIRCTHHSDSIVEESLSKYDYIYLLIDSNVLKHIQRCHGVHSRDDGGKQQVLLQ